MREEYAARSARRRVRGPNGFKYYDVEGRRVNDPAVLDSLLEHRDAGPVRRISDNPR